WPRPRLGLNTAGTTRYTGSASDARAYPAHPPDTTAPGNPPVLDLHWCVSRHLAPSQESSRFFSKSFRRRRSASRGPTTDRASLGFCAGKGGTSTMQFG
ncbi:MAG: hypothetical protein ACK55Z_18030, partial [bacterium]